MNKGFSSQRKLFSVSPPFYSETNTRKSENIFWKIFYSETNGALESKGFRLKKTKTKYLECKFSNNINKGEWVVRLDGQVIPKSASLWYLGSIIYKEEEIKEDMNHRIN